MTLFLLHSLAFLLVFILLSLLGRRLFVTPLRREVASLRHDANRANRIIKLLREATVDWHRMWSDSQKESGRLEQNLRVVLRVNNDLVERYASLKMENVHLVFCHKTACDRLGLLQRVVERLHADNHNLKAELLAKTRKKGERRTVAECLTH